MTVEERVVKELGQYVGKWATCLYKDKRRQGKVVGIRQGPCYVRGTMTTFMNASWGDPYMLWRELDDTVIKSFKWERVMEFKLVNMPMVPAPAPMAPIIMRDELTVRRMRPTLGGAP